jgi:hypothetical protein
MYTNQFIFIGRYQMISLPHDMIYGIADNITSTKPLCQSAAICLLFQYLTKMIMYAVRTGM